MRHSRTLKTFGALALSAALTAPIAGPAQADDADMATYARQGLMNAMQLNANPLYAVAKGQAEYDAAAAAELAANLKILASYPIPSLFPEGTSKPERPGKTRARPAIWEDSLKFEQDFEDLRFAVAKLADNAEAGPEAFIATVTELGQACGGCHNDFRAKDY